MNKCVICSTTYNRAGFCGGMCGEHWEKWCRYTRTISQELSFNQWKSEQMKFETVKAWQK